jgi:hypothetical protein
MGTELDLIETPESVRAEIDETRSAMAALRKDARVASRKIAKQGAMETKEVSHAGKVKRKKTLSTALKVWRETTRTLASMEKRIAVLEEKFRVLHAAAHPEADEFAFLNHLSKENQSATSQS